MMQAPLQLVGRPQPVTPNVRQWNAAQRLRSGRLPSFEFAVQAVAIRLQAGICRRFGSIGNAVDQTRQRLAPQ